MFGNNPLVKIPEAALAAGGATWIERWFRPTVTATMLTCLTVAFVGLIARVVPGWHGAQYVAFAFLMSWVGIQSERLLQRRGPGFSGRFRYRAVEAVLILLLFKLIGYLSRSWDALWSDVRRWGADASSFLDVGFMVGGMGVLGLWMTAVAITKSLYLLEVHPSEITPDPTSPGYDRWTSDSGQRVDRQAVLRDIVRYYFWGGGMLLILTGLARFDIPFLYRYAPPPLSGLVVNAMIYFALGLILISQARFSILQVSWRIRRIEVSPYLGTRWAWLAVAFLLLIIAVALVLPTGYSVGLPQTIALVVRVIVDVLLFVLSFLAYLLALLAALVLNALGMREGAVTQQRPPLAQWPSLSPVEPGLVSNHSWFALLKSVLFWGVFLALLGYSVYHFFRERRGLIPRLDGGLLARLFAWLRAAWERTRRWSARTRQAIAKQLRQPSARGERYGRWRGVRLARLSPRRRVRYFYLSVLRRASRAGHGRYSQQTPYEYGMVLAESVPESAADVVTLTRAFVEARYSQHPMDDGKANAIKRVWRRTCATLARRWHSPGQGRNTKKSHQ